MMEITYGMLTEVTSGIGLYVVMAVVILTTVALVCAVCDASEKAFAGVSTVTIIVLFVGLCYIGTITIPQNVNDISTNFIKEYQVKSILLENSKEEFAKSLVTVEYYNEQATSINDELQSFKDYSKSGFFKDDINEDINLLEPIELITDKDIYGSK